MSSLSPSPPSPPPSFPSATRGPSLERALVVHESFPLPPHSAPPPPVFESLPIDVLHLIAGHLQSARDLCSFEAACRSTRAAASDDNLWRKLCKRFPGPGGREPEGDSTWKGLYSFNHVFLYKVLLAPPPTDGPALTRVGRSNAFFVALPRRLAA